MRPLRDIMKTRNEQEEDLMAKYTVKIDGMSCGHCVSSVTEALQALEGAKDVSVELASGIAKLDTQADPEKIREAIEDIGFDVMSVEEK